MLTMAASRGPILRSHSTCPPSVKSLGVKEEFSCHYRFEFLSCSPAVLCVGQCQRPLLKNLSYRKVVEGIDSSKKKYLGTSHYEDRMGGFPSIGFGALSVAVSWRRQCCLRNRFDLLRRGGFVTLVWSRSIEILNFIREPPLVVFEKEGGGPLFSKEEEEISGSRIGVPQLEQLWSTKSNLDVENLCLQIIVIRDAFTETPGSPSLAAWWKWLLSASIAVSIIFQPWFNEFAIARDETAGLRCENVSQYYNQASGLKSEELKAKLHEIIKGHKRVSYAQVWNALKILDAADVETPETSPDIVGIYSLKRLPKSLSGSVEGWNREHLWPRSYGLMEGRPEFTDVHNLRPADVNVNSSRGNKYFGDCTTVVTTRCLVPANHEAASDTATNTLTWRPPTQVRGDIARALFYMAVRYGSEQPSGSFNLQLTDSPSIANARMGLLSTLLQWNLLDPPSTTEILRNARVCSLYQHNRNPFVDHPEYAGSIWGAPAVTTVSPISNTTGKRTGEMGSNPDSRQQLHGSMSSSKRTKARPK